MVEEIPKYPHLEVVVHNLVKVKGVSLKIRANLKGNQEEKDLFQVDLAQSG